MIGRNYKVDNFKFLLTFLVILGHVFHQISDYDSIKNMYIISWIYFFHMPAFSLISGVYSQKYNFKKALLTCLVPYILLQLIYGVLTGVELEIRIFVKPLYGFWYFFALFIWRILPRYRNIYLLVVICLLVPAIANFIPIDQNYNFSVGRIVLMYPYFLIGYNLKSMNWIKRGNITRWISFIVPSIVILLLIIVKNENLLSLEYLSNNAKELNMSLMSFYLWYFLQLTLVLAMVSSIYSFIPENKYYITKWSIYGLEFYYGHIILMIPLMNLKKQYDFDFELVLSVVITLILIVFIMLLITLYKKIIEIKEYISKKV